MSKGYRNGAFALGLVTGGGIALNLFLWLDYKAQNKSDAHPQNNSNANGNEVGGLWDRFIGTFVSPSDTLAQWIMAIFTIVVVVLVYRTLVATREAVRSADEAVSVTREIGEIQARAYLTYRNTSVGGSADRNNIDVRTGYMFNINFNNVGQTPAKKTQITSRRDVIPNGQIPPQVTVGSDPHPHQFDGSLMGPGNYASGNPQVFTLEELDASIDGSTNLTISSRVDYADIFGVRRFAECCVIIQVRCDSAYLRQAEIDVDRAFLFSMYGPNNTGD